VTPSHPAANELALAMVSARAFPYVGGVETHVAETSRRIAVAGARVNVLTTDPTGALPRVEATDGVIVRRYPARPRRRDWYFSPRLGAAVRDCGADIVHVQGIHTLVAPVALAAAERAGLPVVLTFHTGGHSGALRRLLRSAQWRAMAPLIRRAAALVAVCEYEIALFSRVTGLPESRFTLIRNGADPLPTVPTPSGCKWATADPLIVSVGRLERYKGHQRLVAAMPAVLAEAPGAHLMIVGEGPYGGTLARAADRLGVERSVELTSFGPERRAELGSLIERADVVALMSDYEAHPIAVMEALALGRPVVVAATSGLVELAREGLVTAVPPRTASAALARQLLVSARTGSAGGHVPAPVRSWEACAADLLDLYRQLAR
jgi:glycosyltransferase involved in cell wall biosynthesis